MAKKIEMLSIKQTIENKQMISRHKKEIKEGKEMRNKELTKQMREDLEKMEEVIKSVGYYGPSYRLRRCANKHQETNRCIFWDRNRNAAKNMTKMMINLLIDGTKGCFVKKRKTNKAEKIKINKKCIIKTDKVEKEQNNKKIKGKKNKNLSQRKP